MPAFPSMDWINTLVALLEKDPAVLPALRDWGGRSVGVIIGKDGPLTRDFCVYAKPHATEPRLLALHECEDEDDLEIEEPDYLFRVPYGTVKQVLTRKLDPLEVLKKGQVRVTGDVGFLIPLAQKHKGLGEAAVASIDTRLV